MKSFFIFILALLYVSIAFAQTDIRLKGLDIELNEILSVTKAAGFAVAVVEKDKVIYSKGFGYRDYENKIPADANTLFAIGSCTKAFTSAILGQLAAGDKLSFDDSPLKYVPELKFHNDEMNNNIIIKDLISHRTGLPRHDFSWYLFPDEDRNILIKRIKYQKPFTGLRKKWYYNNFMFLAQGVIAERITSKSWEDNIRERFFAPLGMIRSNVSIGELKNSANAAFGYKLVKDSIVSKMDYYNISGMSPAGSINSSVNEMANWVITWIYKGKFKDKQIIPANYVDEAMGSQMVINGALPDKDLPDVHLANYGYAWFISSYKGHYRVEHGGNIDGFAANTAFFPSDSIGIIVLANQNGSAVPGMVRNMIADRMLKVNKTHQIKLFLERKSKAKKEEIEALAKRVSNNISNTKPSHILQDYTGKYTNDGYGEFNIVNHKDSIFAHFKLKKFYLRHVHYDIFEPFEVTENKIDTSESGTLRFNFLTNDGGEISSVKMNIEPTWDPIEFKRTPNTIEVEKSMLEKYIGEYELAGTVIKVFIKGENKLFLFVPGQPEYELMATERHKFAFKTLEGYKVEFTESKEKAIIEVIFFQPNGTFTAKRK